jgi:ABC-type phosphate/phosphonate transport system substrate-binding protein
MKKTLALALAATTALSTGAFAEEITEFRIGILGGENAQDRLNNYQCLPTTRPKPSASRPSCSPRPTTTA